MARTRHPRSCKLVQAQPSCYEELRPQTPASRTPHGRRSHSVPTKEQRPVLKQASRARTRTGEPNRALEARRRWFESIPECTIESDTSAHCAICDQTICLDSRRVLYPSFYENHLQTLGHRLNALKWEKAAAGPHRTNAENLTSTGTLNTLVDADTHASIPPARNFSEPSPDSDSQLRTPRLPDHAAVRLDAALALLSIGQRN